MIANLTHNSVPGVWQFIVEQELDWKYPLRLDKADQFSRVVSLVPHFHFFLDVEIACTFSSSPIDDYYGIVIVPLMVAGGLMVIHLLVRYLILLDAQT